MKVTVEVALESTDELLAAMHRLVPQLSTSAVPMTFAELAEVIDSPSCTLLVARDEAGIVGTLTLVIFRIPSGLRAWIEDVIVDESARGRGVGELLTLDAIDRARTANVSTIDLTSRATREAANRLYVKLGFEPRDTNVYRFSVEVS